MKFFGHIFFLFLVCSCGLLGGKKQIKKGEIVVNVDSTMIYKDQKIDVKEGVSTPIPDSSFIVQASGFLPMYVIPIEQRFNKNELNMVKMNSDYMGNDLNNILRGNLSEALFKIHEIQGNIYKKKNDQALEKIKDFEKEYGQIAFITYLKATVYYLNKNNEEARATLNSLQEKEKESERVKSFLQVLK